MLACADALGVSAWAQPPQGAGISPVPRAEVSATYSFVRDFAGGPGSNLHGGSASVAGNIGSSLGLVGDLGGYKVSGLPSGFSGTEVTYLFGPRLSYRADRVTPFVQVLFGGAHVSAAFAGSSASANSFAMTAGGGLDIKATEHVGIRLFQVEYLLTRFGGDRQNNGRFSTGLVFRLGRKR